MVLTQTLTTLQSRFSKSLAPCLPEYLSLTLSTLASLQPVFETYYLASSPDAPEPPSPTSDAGFMPPKNNVDDLACAAFDFLTPVVRAAAVKDVLVTGPKGREDGTDVLRAVISMVAFYIQVTRENVRDLATPPLTR